MCKFFIVLLAYLTILKSETGTIATVSKKTSHNDQQHHGRWNYKDQKAWGSQYKACSGNRQSPIDISSQDVVFDKKLTNIKFVGDLNTNASVVNNGHTVNLDLTNQLRLTGGELKGDFLVKGIHFHWGADKKGGSEHTIDKKRYALEMHIVTYKESGYLNIQKAAQGSDSLAVYGVLFEQTAKDNVHLKPLLKVLYQIRNSTKSVRTEKPINFGKVLPSDYSINYMRYLGSLTTPPCTENVIWTLALGTSYISEAQLKKFRQLREVHPEEHQHEGDSKVGNRKLTRNWREIQKLNGRQILSSSRKNQIFQHRRL